MAARAQSTLVDGTQVGFVNGVLQFNPDSPLLTPPGTGMEVAPPTHPTALAQEGASTTSTEGVPQSGSRRKRAKARQHDRNELAAKRRKQRNARRIATSASAGSTTGSGANATSGERPTKGRRRVPPSLAPGAGRPTASAWTPVATR